MGNAILEAIASRRSHRRFADKQVADGELQAVLEAGTWSPSGKGAQAATIVVVQDKELIARLSRMNAKIMGVESDPYYGAPTIILVFADPEKPTWLLDGAAVLTTMGIAAKAVGLATCLINREQQMFESSEVQELLRAWKLPESLKGVGALSVGYPAAAPGKPAPRKENYIIRVS
ncbi:MAG: nitroreductase family protein [Planctomycetes bacterium]|nr:nitroreductase family protein [Planctomycetota bacterium]